MRQFPSVALHDPATYASDVADMHRQWDGINVMGFAIGPTMVDVFDRLGFYRIFTAPWFVLLLTVLVVSIICCTLDRTPALWRSVRIVHVEQPEPFFDLRLPERAAFRGVELSPDELATVLRRKHFRTRRAAATSGAAAGSGAAGQASRGGATMVYGDRNQYLKLATLLTHLGLILFLAGGAVTAAFGFETVLFVADGQTAPVQPVGTPHNMLVKNIDFQAPQRPDGSFADFSTDLAVYQDGQEIARKTIRVNDPLTVNGFVFHQNTFGPSASVDIRDASGDLVWTGPIILIQNTTSGLPTAFETIPGSEVGLELILDRAADGTGILDVIGIGQADAAGRVPVLFGEGLAQGTSTKPSDTAGYTISWTASGGWSGMVIKDDPGQNVIWFAFLCLMSGLLLSFYFPRRRVWARLEDGRLQLAMLADRYVDAEREFGALVAEIEKRTGLTAERSAQ